MKLPLETRIGRLERQRDVLRAQLPFAGPGQSERRYLAELLGVVGSALIELRRRQGVQHRRDLMAIADAARVPYGTADSTAPARQVVSRPLNVTAFVKGAPPAPSVDALPMPVTAWRREPEGPLVYEVVWPRSVAS